MGHGLQLIISFLFLAIFGGAQQALAQAAGSKPFASGLSHQMFGRVIPDSGPVCFSHSVSTLLRPVASRVVVGGTFTHAGRCFRSFALVQSSTGELISGVPPRFEVGGGSAEIHAAAPDGAGGWFIAGSFTHINGFARSNIAKLDSFGNVDLTWNSVVNNDIYTLLLQGGVLYIGGLFTSAGGQIRNRIAALSSATGLATAWNPNANNTVRTLATDGGTLFAGGDFTTIGAQSRNRLASLSFSTGNADSWNPNASGIVRALYLRGSSLFVGGDFTSVGGSTRNRLAEVSIFTAVATSWNPNMSSSVFALAGDSNFLYVGGAFLTANGITRNRLASYDWGSLSLSGWSPTVNGSVFTLTADGTNLYVGGNFTEINSTPRQSAAAFDFAGSLLTWDPKVFSAVAVRSLYVQGGVVLLAGNFQGVSAMPRDRLAAFDTHSGHLTDWNPSVAGINVEALNFMGSQLVVGGVFTSVGGQSRSNLASLDPYTGQATSWNPNVDGAVSALVSKDSLLYAGGAFTQINGTTVNRVAAFDMTLGTASRMIWHGGPDGGSDKVYALALFDGHLIMGGTFLSFLGLGIDNLGALDPNTGAARSSWQPNPNGPVRALKAVGSKLYVGGEFTNVPTLITRLRLAAYNANGGGNPTLDSSWTPQADSVVWSLDAYQGQVFIGGVFSTLNGTTRNSAGAVSSSGVVNAWSPMISVGPQVRTILVTETDVFVGGVFTNVNSDKARRPFFAPFNLSTGSLPGF